MLALNTLSPADRWANSLSTPVFYIGGLFPCETTKSIRELASRKNLHLFENRDAVLNGDSIEDRVSFAIRKMESRYVLVPKAIDVVCHSLGVLIACKIMEIKPHLIKSVVAIAPTVHKGLEIPFRMKIRLAKLKYLLAMATGNVFSLTPSDEEILRDGADVELGPESGTIVRQLKSGYPVRPLSSFSELGNGERVMIITPEDDNVLGYELGLRIASFHGGNQFSADGGHFAHMDSRYSETIWDKIGQWINR